MRKIGESYYLSTLYNFLEAKIYTVGYNILFVCTLYNVHVRDKYLSHAELIRKNVNLSKFKCSLTYTRPRDNGEKCLHSMNNEY
jgi:hypothetical protein